MLTKLRLTSGGELSGDYTALGFIGSSGILLKILIFQFSSVQGPNWLWHIDRYDKRKPYGFAIHGAIDG